MKGQTFKVNCTEIKMVDSAGDGHSFRFVAVN